MNRIYIFNLFIIIFLLLSFSISEDNKDNNLNYGYYANNSGARESEVLMLNLQKDKTYSLIFDSEFPFKMDSGVFQIFNDTIFLDPSVKFDGVLSIIDSNIKSKQTKILINQGRLKIIGLNNSLADSFTMTRQGLRSELKNLLDKNGNGYARLIDQYFNTIEEGYYKDYKIYNGKKYIYENSLSNLDSIPQGVELRVYVSSTVNEVKEGVEQ